LTKIYLQILVKLVKSGSQTSVVRPFQILTHPINQLVQLEAGFH